MRFLSGPRQSSSYSHTESFLGREIGGWKNEKSAGTLEEMRLGVNLNKLAILAEETDRGPCDKKWLVQASSLRPLRPLRPMRPLRTSAISALKKIFQRRDRRGRRETALTSFHSSVTALVFFE